MSGYYDRPLAGVGGWLTFFLIVIGILSPLRIVFETIMLHGDPNAAAAFGDAWAIVMPLEWTFSAAQLAICWYIAWRLLKVETWRTVQIAIAGLWAVGLGIPGLELITVAVIGGIPAGELAVGVGVDLVRNLLVSGLWTAYFLCSERVANTYARSGEPDEMAEVFS